VATVNSIRNDAINSRIRLQILTLFLTLFITDDRQITIFQNQQYHSHTTVKYMQVITCMYFTNNKGYSSSEI